IPALLPLHPVPTCTLQAAGASQAGVRCRVDSGRTSRGLAQLPARRDYSRGLSQDSRHMSFLRSALRAAALTLAVLMAAPLQAQPVTMGSRAAALSPLVRRYAQLGRSVR